MPIGNQEIWDKGIGAGATNVIFGGGDTQPSATNFNPGALGADPNASSAETTSVETPAAPPTSAPPATGTQPPTPAGPHPKVVAAKNALDMATMKYQQALQGLGGKSGPNDKYGGMSIYNWMRALHEAQQRYMQAQQQYGG